MVREDVVCGVRVYLCVCLCVRCVQIVCVRTCVYVCVRVCRSVKAFCVFNFALSTVCFYG